MSLVSYQVLLIKGIEEDEEFLYVTFPTLEGATYYAHKMKELKHWERIYVSRVERLEIVDE